MKLPGIFALAFTIFYILFNRDVSLMYNLSNAFFIVGIIYLLITLAFYVRNVGFFKTLAYHRYKRKQLSSKRMTQEGESNETMSFYDFYEEHYKDKWSGKVFIIWSIPLLVTSYVIAFFIL
ncbi:DUF3899 domain-containing protein [Tissierella sp. MSJ-40]|uniref:DUF3899 domain-containing protein n=1 Tax=Tissierella simiarum TaxID=2841534 RepID=A0ABS6E769_9FIRM|nr:DUF3899 domain-containing protein [Tissierella simiarum]MBU5438763.1 DUF3899 domain-containing protein [Tissierella simiarum]